jgi:hypothetical protein
VRRLSSDPAAGPWTSYFVAVQFLLVFPLLPLGAELLFTSQVAAASLMLVAATYAISLSMSSRNLAIWSIGCTFGFAFSALFGWSMGLGSEKVAFTLSTGIEFPSGWFWTPVCAIAFVFTLHLWGRFERHVEDGEPFPEFLTRR